MAKQCLATMVLLLLISTYSACNAPLPAPKPSLPLVIDVQPLGSISTSLVQKMLDTLRKHYQHIQVLPAQPLPKHAFYPARQRFRADSLIVFLQQNTPANHATIGITNVDISTSKGNITDWGVMGLGFCPGKACITSSYRLNKIAIASQLFKVAIHELGHTQGLKHCSVSYCFMQDAKGGNPTNLETDFCPSCKATLIAKGWVF
ncbi:matrixin family metalloprotease [Parasediminibacterium paludis]|uniref:Matrixin family metalloprotease n=1 Tax=Parasediminibacterium paludis TaxID=908966 RepID=A0ABV8Q0S4_9BACT